MRNRCIPIIIGPPLERSSDAIIDQLLWISVDTVPMLPDEF